MSPAAHSTENAAVNLQIEIPQDSTPDTLCPIEEVTEHEYTTDDQNSERGLPLNSGTPAEDVDDSTLVERTIEFLQESATNEQPLFEDSVSYPPETKTDEPPYDDEVNEDERSNIGTICILLILLSLTILYQYL